MRQHGGPAVELLLHFAKILAVAVLFAGTLGAFVARDLRDRRLFAFALAGPGFGASWACGFGLAAAMEVPLLSTWILGGLVLSFFSLQVVLFAVGKEGRRTPLVATLAIAPLVGTVALMVWKP
ncbi:MAG: hypothetical protein ACRENE_05865 [Polyangiaceae bacterium]